MSYLFRLGLLSGFLLLHGCSPTLNWRDVRLDSTPLRALFPCKPEQAARAVSLGAQVVTFTMLACDAGDAKFALAYADAKDPARAAPLLAQWASVTLSNMRAPSPHETPFLLKGADPSPPAVRVQASGVRPDGSAVVLHSVWFAAGSRVYQAAVYADTARAPAAQTYFEGLRLQ